MGTSDYALIVIDMQEHFRGMAEPIIPELNRTIRACHDLSIPGVKDMCNLQRYCTSPVTLYSCVQ